jgi:hypothetical protein
VIPALTYDQAGHFYGHDSKEGWMSSTLSKTSLYDKRSAGIILALPHRVDFLHLSRLWHLGNWATPRFCGGMLSFVSAFCTGIRGLLSPEVSVNSENY